MAPIELRNVENRVPYLNDLLLADEDESVVKTYINQGILYAIALDKKEVGVCLFTFPTPKTVEVKNIAVREAFRGRGIGKEVLKQAFKRFAPSHEKMIVGTSNSSIDNIAFYQKAGFRFHHIKKGFFLKYSEPFYENGIQGVDMIVFCKQLTELK
ncbi:GNAT family N-acetyltransferase [Halobacillus litoralis]|uniref:GNAT family N-acetyltransferase n=1 Tax=Halobacillus litoralis TaxID=45668 RepID=UPI0039A6C80F